MPYLNPMPVEPNPFEVAVEVDDLQRLNNLIKSCFERNKELLESRVAKTSLEAL